MPSEIRRLLRMGYRTRVSYHKIIRESIELGASNRNLMPSHD